MKNTSTRWMMIASLVAAGVGATATMGCSSSSDTTGTGGTTGGAGGKGGSTTVADSGTDATPVVHLVAFNFDSTIQGWSLNNFADTNSRNLGATYATDGGGADAQVFDGGVVTAPTLTFDSALGDPLPGSLKVTATFTDCGQYVDATVILNPTVNLTGKTLHGRLQVTSGNFSGGAQLHLQTGADYGAYTSADFTLGVPATSFGAAALDLTTAVSVTPEPLDLTLSIQVGIQIFSGSACTALLPYPNAGEPVTFNLDTITD
jgi:hypothetical protein